MSWYFAALKKYVVFHGRARRAEYWYFFLFNLIITVLLAFADNMAGTFNAETGAGLLGALYALAVFLPGLGVCIRRLHDTDRSGWWVLIILVPFIGILVLLAFMVIDSDQGENRFGPYPPESPEGDPADQ